MTGNAARPTVQQTGSAMPLVEGYLRTAETIRPASPLLGLIAAEIAKDAAVLDLAKAIAPGQVPSLLLFVAAFLLGKHPGEPLRAYFLTFTDDPLPPEAAYPVFREFCLRRADELRPLLASRTLQMTVAERGSTVLYALDHVSKAVKAPLQLIEVGCSAGLLLQFDRYFYDFGGGRTVGDPASPVKITTELRGDGTWTPGPMPRVGARVGIDLKLCDPGDADASDWIRACIFPEWRGAAGNISRGLDLLNAAPIDLREGDALDLLPAAAAELGDPICIYHSFCLYQWPDRARDAFDRLLGSLSLTRDVHRVSIETPERGPGEIVHQFFRQGRLANGWSLGRCDLFGRWIEVADI